MGIKRIIAPDDFNIINGCFIENFLSRGHTPVRVVTRYYKQTDSTTEKRPVPINKRLLSSITSRTGFYLTKNVQTYERSPHITIDYKNVELWDEAINKICSQWGKESWTIKMTTVNRDNNKLVEWAKATTENPQKNTKLVLASVDGVDWLKCTYKMQQQAAGDFWEDTCEYAKREKVSYRAVCEAGSH